MSVSPMVLILILIWTGQIPAEGAPKSITSKTTGAKLLLIPAGEFQIGSPDSDPDARANEKPQHRVVISKSFYLGETEVTQKQWRLVMGTEPWTGKNFVREGVDYPATYVSWKDAQEYCKRLSEQDGRAYRLPTEAEWEYTCRAGTKTKWSFGESQEELGQYAWYKTYNEGECYAHQVGQKMANPWGLRDMHGNVWEWCWDRYGDYPSRAVTDPQGPDLSEVFGRVIRGGGWGLMPDERSAVRWRFSLEERSCIVGFRLASNSAEPPSHSSAGTASIAPDSTEKSTPSQTAAMKQDVSVPRN